MPSNVAWFEQLMYGSLVVGVVLSVLTWTQNVAQARPFGGASFVLLVQVSVLAFMILFIWLTARRRKNWARWLLLIVFVLGFPLFFPALVKMLRFDPVVGTLNLTQVLAQAVALFVVFSGDARDWFQQSHQRSN